jgi:hypothetical protein
LPAGLVLRLKLKPEPLLLLLGILSAVVSGRGTVRFSCMTTISQTRAEVPFLEVDCRPAVPVSGAMEVNSDKTQFRWRKNNVESLHISNHR